MESTIDTSNSSNNNSNKSNNNSNKSNNNKKLPPQRPSPPKFNSVIINQELNNQEQNNQLIRPSWDNYFKKIVMVTSERSACERLHVGCILVKDNRIVAQGYNGFLPGCPHTSIVREGHEQATVHAEQNAIADCAKRGAACAGTTAYVTHYPCIICARLLLASGIQKIKYINDYKNDLLVAEFCNQCGVDIEKLE